MGGATTQTQNKAVESEATGETGVIEDRGLSVYAQRLEAAILQELKQALLDMEHEGEQVEMSQPQGDDKNKIERDDMEL